MATGEIPHEHIEGPAGSPVRLYAQVVVVGVAGAAVGAAFVAALHLVQDGLWPTHWSTAAHLLVLAGVGVAVTICLKLLGTPGDVELLVNNIHVNGGPEERRDLRSLIPISLLCVGSGGGMGPEAPLVQTTGAMGAWLAERFHLSRDDMRVLTITGMAAGFTVLFGAPFGSAVFALELPHRRGLQYYEALIPAVIGSLSGYAVYGVLTHNGLGPVWHIGAAPTSLTPGDLGWAVVCGVAGAAVAAGFTYGAVLLRWVIRPVPADYRPVLCGLALGLLAFWSKYALTFGEAQISPLAMA
ncbi:MAG TPA: chloride channel protein, partial [Acidimicrobiales bacterium]